MSTPTPLNPKATEEALFQAAGPLDEPARKLFLDWACAGEPELRQRLEDRLFEDDASTVIRPQHLPEEDLFQAAILLPAAARASFLAVACKADASLRQRLEALLAAHVQPETLLEPQANRRDGSDEFSSSAQGVAEVGPQDQETSRRTIKLDLPDAPDEAVGQTLGRYKLLEKVGEGGCGAVYVAEQTEPVRRRVALKVIKLGMNTKQVVARFEAERQALAMMDHPNIAKVFDAGTTETGRPYFIMELVRGIRITDYCDQNNLSTRERLDLFIKVCQAIQHAHQKGIIHRDIKPSNILVTLHDGVPVPKVIDFGIAKATEGRLTDATVYTQLHQFIGTPAYMSPEQAEMSGLDIDTRSDIYSLGVLLYELLAGSTPFDAKELMASGIDAMRKTIRDKEPVRPSTRLATLKGEELTTTAKRRSAEAPKLIHLLKGDLDWIVMKCLEKDRTRRYETANDLAADLKRHLNNEPVVARPPSAAYRIQKFIRRNKASVAAAVVIALLLVAGVIGTSLGLVRAERERSKAVTAATAATLASDQAQKARDLARDKAKELETSLYLNRLALAHRELTAEPPNIDQAEKLLEACPVEMRGWEWNCLKRLWHDEPFVLHDPGKKGIHSVSLSSDDAYVASAGGDGYLRIWNVTTRQLLQSIPAHTNGFAFSVAFDPADPTRIISAGSDKQIKLWDRKTANLIHSWPCYFTFEWGMAYGVAFSPDGRRIAAQAEEGSVQIWDAITGAKFLTLPSHDTVLFSAAFSPDGRRLAVGSADGVVRVWDMESGHRLQSFGRPGPPVACVAFSRDGQRLASASFDCFVRTWDAASGREIFQSRADKSEVLGLVFSADKSRLATAGHDRTVKLLDGTTGQPMLVFRDFSKQVECVAFSRDGDRLVAGGLDGTIRLWDATPIKGEEGDCLLTLEQPTRGMLGMGLSPDGLWLASGGSVLPGQAGEKAPVFIWETKTGRLVRTLTSDAAFVFSAAFSPDGRFLASPGGDPRGSGAYTVSTWDMGNPREAFATQPFEGEGILFGAAYSPDGRYLVAAGHGGRLIVWNAATGRRIRMLGEQGGGRTVFNLAFSPNGRYLASTSPDGSVKVWDGTRLEEQQTNAMEIQGASGGITDSLAFSPDGGQLVVATSGTNATIWDVHSGIQVLHLHSHREHGFLALAFSSDGRWIASGGTDGTVKLWSARTGEMLRTFRGHKADIVRLRFLSVPGPPRLVSGDEEGTIKFWDMRPLQQ